MNSTYIGLIIYASSIILGVTIGLIRAQLLKRDFPEFFSSHKHDDEIEFTTVSKNIKLVNSIPNKELSIERFIQFNKL